MNNSYDYLIGFGRVDITPTESVPRGGYGSTLKRMSRVIRDRIYADCIAITDRADNTVLIISMDLVNTNAVIVEKARDTIEKMFGIKGDHVMISATHTHASVDTFAKIPVVEKYIEDMGEKLLPAAAAIALADRQSAKMFVGQFTPHGFNFIRHYKAIPTDGREPFYFGDNHIDGKLDDNLVQNESIHATDIYETAHLVKFTRETGKDLLIMNWRAHATLCSGMNVYDLSADFIGDLRRQVEDKTDCQFTYFQGAAGNVNPKTRIKKEERSLDSVAYSVMLADDLIKGLDSLKYMEPGEIKTLHEEFPVNINHTKDALKDEAKKISDFYKETGDRKTANKMAKDIGLFSVYECNAVVGHANCQMTTEIELNAISLGDVALITAPCELFDNLSVYVEGKAPYKKVLTIGYCNGKRGYMPSLAAYEYGCYEADISLFEPVTLEKTADKFLDMLNKVK